MDMLIQLNTLNKRRFLLVLKDEVSSPSIDEQGHKVALDVLTIDTPEGSTPVVRFNGLKLVSDIGIKTARLNITSASHKTAEDPNQERIVSVSDGITDVMTLEEIDSLIWQMADQGYTNEKMAQILVKTAYIRGSKDNLSATVSTAKKINP